MSSPIVFLKPKRVEISDGLRGDLWVKITDAKGEYHPLIVKADTQVYVANRPKRGKKPTATNPETRRAVEPVSKADAKA